MSGSSSSIISSHILALTKLREREGERGAFSLAPLAPSDIVVMLHRGDRQETAASFAGAAVALAGEVANKVTVERRLEATRFNQITKEMQ